MLAYVYRVTKYDPADRDEHGHYTGLEGTGSDHGEVEAAYLQAVAAFATETGVDHLAIREPGYLPSRTSGSNLRWTATGSTDSSRLLPTRLLPTP
ncbi:hypothetical protein [Streptomyces sp. NBC_00328]|uniref:hypothetical protein n=1 Tax=Streptomyces sp. NBC_00328 TaxID=2903646 RepID=UPI002E27CE59|nr:hypothetical protein [Streptomyces sp. NBC_00328]